MVMIEVDARGKACPEPVIRTKKALDDIQDGVVVTFVDNEVARNNVMKLAKSRGYAANFAVTEDGFSITIEKGNAEVDEEVLVDTHDLVVLVTSACLGKGDDRLGAILMKSYLTALCETSPLPKRMFFINSAVRLTAEGSDVVPLIQKLADQGVSIESCGICLDYYHLKETLAVGSITNMYDVTETLNQAKKVLTL